MPALSFNKKCHHNINVVTALFNNIYALNLFLVLFANQQRASITDSSKLRCYERLKHRNRKKLLIAYIVNGIISQLTIHVTKIHSGNKKRKSSDFLKK